MMNNKPIAYIGIILVLLAIISTMAMIVFADAIRELDYMDLEATAWACFAMTIVGTVISWSAFRHPVGKVSAAIGTLAVLGFLFQLIRSDGPSNPSAPYPLDPPPAAQQDPLDPPPAAQPKAENP